MRSNLKKILLGGRATFVSYFVHYLVPASLLKALKGLYKESFELEGNPKPLPRPLILGPLVSGEENETGLGGSCREGLEMAGCRWAWLGP